MLFSAHEKSRTDVNPPFRQEGTATLFGRTDSGSLGRDKDCCFAAGIRRAASRLDLRGLGFDPHEFRPLDSWCKRRWGRNAEAKGDTGSSLPAREPSGEDPGEAVRAVARVVWAEPSALGRPDVGEAFEAAVWDNAESPASPEVDAPIGLPDEAGQLLLPAGQQ